jgi:peptidoglycan/LPS O-acetylase OafA/YrhL
VDLFFAISGFLITTLLLRERVARTSIDLRAFYLRRSVRIFPLYYLVLGLNVIYALWLRPNWGPSRSFVVMLPYYVTYTANWFQKVELLGPSLFVFAWSLCTEEQFYAFWAPLLRYSKRLVFAAWVMGLLAVCDLLLEAMPAESLSWLPNALRIVLSSFASPIGFGALLAMAAYHPRFGQRFIAVAALPWTVPVVFTLTVSLVVWPWAPVVVLHGLFALLVLVCSARERHALSELLNHPVLAYVGRVSYGIYLWHVVVVGGIKALFPHLVQEPRWLFVLAMPLSVVVAGASFEYFERPWLRLGQRWKRTSSPSAAPTVVLDGEA